MKFKPEHFSNLEFRVSGWQDVPRAAADYANAVLEAHLATLPVIYSRNPNVIWDRLKLEKASHQALLWDVKPIEKECEHAPRKSSLFTIHESCEHCGIKLKATWSPV